MVNLMERDPKKFDPANAAALDAPDHKRILPTDRLLDALTLTSGETVLDYGAGTGRLALAIAERVPNGAVVAVDESPEMLDHLRRRLEGRDNVEVMAVADNRVSLPSGRVDRIVAVNLLHEIRGETTLTEMRRLLAPNGRLLVVDWDRARSRSGGPPDHLLYDGAEAELRRVGFSVAEAGLALPAHFAIVAEVGPMETPTRRDDRQTSGGCR